MHTLILLLTATVVMVGCEKTAVDTPKRWTDAAASQAAPVAPRWYSAEQVSAGAAIFQANCAECHGANAEGTANWREVDAQGKFPPPPLNGSGHTWHHPLSVLRRTVRVGGVPLGGTMPGSGEKLNAREIDSILAWVQSRWPEKIYVAWIERTAQMKRSLQPIKKN